MSQTLPFAGPKEGLLQLPKKKQMPGEAGETSAAAEAAVPSPVATFGPAPRKAAVRSPILPRLPGNPSGNTPFLAPGQ